MAGKTPNYIPRPDGACIAWALQFADACDAEQAKLGLIPKQVTDIKNAVNAFGSALNAQTAAQHAAESARQSKVAERAALEQLVRPFVRMFQSNPNVTDAIRAELGITVPGTPTLRVGIPTTAPRVTVDLPARLTHALRLVDESTPTRTGKPRGAMGAEIWLKLVDGGSGQSAVGSGPNSDPLLTAHSPLTFRFLSLTTKPTVRATFKPADGGKLAVYMTRWVNSRGEPGPWSEMAQATVAA